MSSGGGKNTENLVAVPCDYKYNSLLTMAFSEYCSGLKYGQVTVSGFFHSKKLSEKVRCNLYLLNFIVTNGKDIVLVRLELKHFCYP